MKILVLLSLSFLLFSCDSNPEDTRSSSENSVKRPQETATSSSKKSFLAIYDENLGWGYQIYSGTKVVIDQKHIPALNGMYGFQTRGQAERAAQFIIERMEAGDPRPSVSPQELDSLGCIDLDTLNLPN